MTDKPKNRKGNMPVQPNQTFSNRIIDENWKKLLSSNLMEVKAEKVEEKKNHFTGIFRRARKKHADGSTDVTDLKNLNINNISSNNNIEKINSVSECNYAHKQQSSSKTQNNASKNKTKLTKFIAMDCEMVGVGYEGGDHMLARVSLVNKFGDCIYDKFVKPQEEVVDYRTNISGIRREDLLKGEEFRTVQKEVAEILRGRILVGHSLKNDLGVLFLSHSKKNIRDTSRYKPFRQITKGSTPSLKRLAKEILGIEIQHGEHSSVEDAKAVMQLYCTVAKNWEQALSENKGYSKKFIES
ncbi:jg23880 [Pararge aegeria aegeria]|uniref:RNA exonuclease 4 n=4 Tax=Pararge aegeria TaxID=116150 RepID=A0A8S4S6Y6_9NEOP|nr:jg23880 [Pararge aegeria aegeria]